MDSGRIFTIGHSNHSIPHFCQLLRQHGIGLVADVRSYPGSRRHPQFNRGVLSRALVTEEIHYLWLGEKLGGKVSLPFVEYMETPRFRQGLAELCRHAVGQSVVIMCAEKVHLNCHRNFISDGLNALGWHIDHITENGKLVQHQSTIL